MQIWSIPSVIGVCRAWLCLGLVATSMHLIACGEEAADGISCTVVTDNGEESLQCDDGTYFVPNENSGGGCTVEDRGDGTYLLRCGEGTEVVFSDGSDGDDGIGCTVEDNEDGTHSIQCDDGTEWVISSEDKEASCTIDVHDDGAATITCPGSEAVTVPATGTCTVLGGDLTINNELEMLAFQKAGCSEITGDLIVRDSDTLSSLDGLQSVTAIGGQLRISNNGSLANLHGLAGLKSIGGRLRIDGNDSLVDFEGLQGLESIPEDLRVSNNDNLVSLRGLDGLEFIGNQVLIRNNASLESLEGLEHVESIGLHLRIESNHSLTSILALESLSFIDGSFWIQDNNSLPTCDVEALRDQVGGDNIGSVSISGNDDDGVCAG